MLHNYWAHMLQLLKATCLESVLRNKPSLCSLKPEESVHRSKDPEQPKIDKQVNRVFFKNDSGLNKGYIKSS